MLKENQTRSSASLVLARFLQLMVWQVFRLTPETAHFSHTCGGIQCDNGWSVSTEGCDASVSGDYDNGIAQDSHLIPFSTSGTEKKSLRSPNPAQRHNSYRHGKGISGIFRYTRGRVKSGDFDAASRKRILVRLENKFFDYVNGDTAEITYQGEP